MQNEDVQVWRSTGAGEVNVSLGQVRVSSLVGCQSMGRRSGGHTRKKQGEREFKKADRLLTPLAHGARLVWECQVWLLQQERRGGGQEQRARASLAQRCSARVGRGYRGMQEHCMGAGMCTGHPTWPGGPGCPSALAPAVAIRGRGGCPSCKCESRKGKAHRLPQPVTTNTSLLALECVFISL